MDDLISRQAAIDVILELTDFASVIELFEYVEDHDLQDKRSGGIIDAIDAVLLLPAAQPEQKTGYWMRQEDYDESTYYRCSECGEDIILISGTPKQNNYRFCPNCGADMRGEQDE